MIFVFLLSLWSQVSSATVYDCTMTSHEAVPVKSVVFRNSSPNMNLRGGVPAELVVSEVNYNVDGFDGNYEPFRLRAVMMPQTFGIVIYYLPRAHEPVHFSFDTQACFRPHHAFENAQEDAQTLTLPQRCVATMTMANGTTDWQFHDMHDSFDRSLGGRLVTMNTVIVETLGGNTDQLQLHFQSSLMSLAGHESEVNAAAITKQGVATSLNEFNTRLLYTSRRFVLAHEDMRLPAETQNMIELSCHKH